MPIRRLLRSALFALTFPSLAKAQVDLANLQRRAVAAEQAVQRAIAASQQALAAVRQAIGDPDNKVQGDCTDVENVLKGGTFDAGLGVVPIAIEHLEYVAEDKRTATKQALESLRGELAAGSLALQQQEALQELHSRMAQLDAFAADDDATGALADLAASAAKATRSRALPVPDLAELQQHLARRRQANHLRIGTLRLQDAKAELAKLQEDFAGMRSEMSHADANERDRGCSRFDEAARSIRTALARVDPARRKPVAAELAALQATADDLYARAYGAATLARIRENWQFTADQFEAWADEASGISARGYLDFESPNAETFGVPRTVALVGRANAWLAYVGQDADWRRNQLQAEVAAFTRSIEAQRAAALAKLLPLVRSVVDGLDTIPREDDRVRGRMQVLADWDLPLALQLHPELRTLRGKVHALLDTHARQAHGEAAGLTTIREQALTAADGLWPRLLQWLPAEGGFDPLLPSLFAGRLMRLEGVWLRTGEFAPAPATLVFDVAGELFVATMGLELASAVQASRARLQLDGALPTADAPIELLAVIGEPAEVALLGKAGKADALGVAATAVRLIGLRQGAVFAVVP